GLMGSIAPATGAVAKIAALRGRRPAPARRRRQSCPATARGLRFLSRGLVRRHLMHFAGLEVEAHARDVVEIGAGHAHKTRIVGIIDGMDLAVLVDAGMARLETIFLHRLE